MPLDILIYDIGDGHRAPEHDALLFGTIPIRLAQRQE